MKKQEIKAFTLVELIIVITILAILATIGFMSYQSYTSDARDSNRITSIKSAQDGLEIYMTKKSTYPIPDSRTTFTGGNTSITQGILSKTISDTIKLSEIKDPSTNNYYIYSTSGNGKYYQIRADLENSVSYNSLVNTTYASATKALVKGNYSFDPGLPSLITVTGSVNTSSGIFDPNVCFVIDGGTNLVTSNSTNCTQKKNMSLKDFDSGLVGYWDMETLTGTMLKDLSGNGNDLLCQSINSSITSNIDCKNKLTNTGIISKAMQFTFDGTNSNVAQIQKLLLNGTGLIDYSNGFTINYISKEDNSIYDTETPLVHNNYWFHRNKITGLTGIRSATFSGEFLQTGETSCRPSQLICMSQLQFLKNNYIASNFNLHTIVMNTTFSYYLNGMKIYEFPIEKTTSVKNISVFYLGGTSTTNLYFNGIIDDVKIYNRVLSDSEIAQQARIAGF